MALPANETLMSRTGVLMYPNEAAALVSLYLKPQIYTQPSDVTDGAVDGTAAFTVAALNATSYQWYLDTDGAGFVLISGATSASYTTPTLVSGDDGNLYRCVITNAYGTTTSDSAELTIA